jgi:hypothetical protein
MRTRSQLRTLACLEAGQACVNPWQLPEARHASRVIHELGTHGPWMTVSSELLEIYVHLPQDPPSASHSPSRVLHPQLAVTPLFAKCVCAKLPRRDGKSWRPVARRKSSCKYFMHQDTGRISPLTTLPPLYIPTKAPCSRWAFWLVCYRRVSRVLV